MNALVVAAALATIALAGCSEEPPNPAGCPSQSPFHLEGPVEVRVGYGQVWVSNATAVYRFQVPQDTDFARKTCSEVPGSGPQGWVLEANAHGHQTTPATGKVSMSPEGRP